MQKIVVVIPTYNEAENLFAITAELFSLPVDNLEILVVDDNSPDGTGDLADTLAKRYAERFHVIHRMDKAGLGTAYVAGFAWALDHGADLVVQMDADFSHSPSYIPKFMTLMDDYDVVVGSRYVKHGRIDEGWHPSRRFLSWWANSVWTRLALGVATRDATAGFKCWRRSALEKINLDEICSNGYVFQVEMCYIAEKLKLRMLEVPIYFEDRRVGKSKMTPLVKIEAALRVFEIRWRNRKLGVQGTKPSFGAQSLNLEKRKDSALRHI